MNDNNLLQNVYVHQINGPFSKNLLPLAGGLITSYAKSISIISDNYSISLHTKRDNPAKTVASYVDPDVLAFSVYSWNFQQSLAIAQQAKKRFPQILIVFGGPMIGLTQRPEQISKFFAKYQFIDIIVHGMGEWTFASILENRLNNTPWTMIDGLSYRTATGYQSTAPANFSKDLNELTSPFLDGTFEKLLSTYGHGITGALWETNRGCPFRCTFCVQGDSAFNNILLFDTERLLEELNWLSYQQFEYLFATDANFGIKERDMILAEKIAHLKTENGYPKYFLVNWMKNSSNKVLEIAEKLRSGGINSRMTLSRQSFDENTLEAIKRKNIKLSTYDHLKQEATQKNIVSYTELILGLSRDSRNSFLNSLEQAMDPSISHFYVVYLCRLLEGTEMSIPEIRKKYGFITRTCRVGFGRRGNTSESGVPEYEEIIVGQKSMSISDWKECYALSVLSLAFYNFRLLFFIFNYLRDQYDVNVLNLIQFIYKHASKYKSLNNIKNIITACQNSILQNKSALTIIDVLEDTLLEPQEAVCMKLLDDLDTFYEDSWTLLTKFLIKNDINFDREILKEIFRYQKHIVPTWKQKTKEKLDTNYSINKYFDYLCRGQPYHEITKEKEELILENKWIVNPHDFCKSHLTFVMFKIANLIGDNNAKIQQELAYI